MAEEHVFDLIPGYVLGALDEGERVQVEAHLAACARCQQEIESYQGVMDSLPLAVKISQPPPELKDKIFAQIVDETRGLHTSEDVGWRARLRRSFPTQAPTWAVISLVIVVFLALSNLMLWQQLNDLQSQNQSTLTTIAMRGTEFTPDSTGMLVMSLDGEYGVLIADMLPELSGDEQYQLWLIRDGERTSGGVFSVNDEGYGSLVVSSVDPLSSYTTFGITVEPAGGSPGPTGIKVLGGDA